MKPYTRERIQFFLVDYWYVTLLSTLFLVGLPIGLRYWLNSLQSDSQSWLLTTLLYASMLPHIAGAASVLSATVYTLIAFTSDELETYESRSMTAFRVVGGLLLLGVWLKFILFLLQGQW